MLAPNEAVALVELAHWPPRELASRNSLQLHQRRKRVEQPVSRAHFPTISSNGGRLLLAIVVRGFAELGDSEIAQCDLGTEAVCFVTGSWQREALVLALGNEALATKV